MENFGGQWLQTRALESHTPDRTKFPEFTDYTRMSMKKETDLFFEHILREDRPILDFLDANYTFLNQRLAEFYGIPGVKGHEFRKVDLTGTPRGGVWPHASVLTVSSYANRTSPVLRGKWILENLLNAPPPPPPPDVPSLDEQAARQVRLAARAAGEAPRQRRPAPPATRAWTRWASPWRTSTRSAAGARRTASSPSTPSATLPDGRSFKGHDGLAAILKADPAPSPSASPRRC